MITGEQKAEIEKKVMQRFPISAEERRGCQQEKLLRGKARQAYREKLIKEINENNQAHKMDADF